MSLDAASLAADLRLSRKYRDLCTETLARVSRWAVSRGRSRSEAAERARRKLHQVYGAYLSQWNPAGAERLLAALAPGASEATLRETCRRILRMHTSTRERLGLMDQVYEAIFRRTGRPRRVLDLGCGLHPFAIPWMNLPADTQYACWEIDERIVGLLNRFLPLTGREPLACAHDLLATDPDQEADLVFLLKTLPCLEQQEKGCGEGILRKLRTPIVVMSFPAYSIGGREKGMRSTYAQWGADLCIRLSWQAETLHTANEVFLIAGTGQGGSPAPNDQTAQGR